MNKQKRYRPKQRGGTFLGLIIGVIIGLGIAVVVAFIITKTPGPFTYKAQQLERKELLPSQSVDPNKPLYGNRDILQEATPDQAAIGTSPPSWDISPSQDNSDIENKWIYYLQTGAFRTEADAEHARAKLALLGFEARISETTYNNSTLYRVRIGPLLQAADLDQIRSKLSENGIQAADVRLLKR